MLLTLAMHAARKSRTPAAVGVRPRRGSGTRRYVDAASAGRGSLVVRTTSRLPYVTHTR